VQPETVELSRVLGELNVTHEQLIDIGILVGTDFNPDGVKGIGPKTALKLIQQHGTLEKVLPIPVPRKRFLRGTSAKSPQENERRLERSQRKSNP